MNKLVSIIIPVYNSEKFLKGCLDSVLCQIYSNIEVLLIDDGSKDNSLEICNSYAQKDNRVKVFHQENSGAAAARNKGLANVSGEYIMFCDSDDVVSKNWVKHLLEAVNDYTMPVCSSCNDLSCLGKKNTISVESNTIYKQSSYFSFNYVGLAGFLWNTIFVKSIITKNHLSFRIQKDKSDYNEDLLFVMEYIKNIEYFIYVGYSDYAYITREDSLSRKYNPFYFDKYAEKYKLWCVFIEQYGNKKDIKALSTNYLYHFLISLQSEINNRDEKLTCRYSRFKKIIISEVLQKCIYFADTSVEDQRVVKMIKNKYSLNLWIYMSLVSIKYRRKRLEGKSEE